MPNVLPQIEDSSQAWIEYKNLRNRINNIIKCEERNYKRKQVSDTLHTPSKFWSMAKEFMNWKSDSGPPTQLEIEGKLVSKASTIASAMNNFFINKVKTIREDIEVVPSNFDMCYKII